MQNKELFLKYVKEILEQLLAENYGYYFIKSRLQACNNKRMLVTGSSYAIHGILDGEYQDICNLSGTSQDIYCSYQLAKKVIENQKQAGETLCTYGVILLGYYALFDDLSMNKSSRELMRTVYQPHIDSMHHYEAEMYDRWITIQRKYDFWEPEHGEACDEWMNHFLENKNYFNEVYHREDNVEEQYREILWTQLNPKDRERWAEHRAQVHNKLLRHEETAQENAQLLDSYIGMLTKEGIKPVVVIPPFSKEYVKKLDPLYQSSLLEVLENSEYAVEYMDFNQMDCWEAEDFFDMDHLNDTGARKLTELILRELY